eukprot:SAG31_NODE_33236_length_346_cov_0.829960_1_plen_59_part_01
MPKSELDLSWTAKKNLTYQSVAHSGLSLQLRHSPSLSIGLACSALRPQPSALHPAENAL